MSTVVDMIDLREPARATRVEVDEPGDLASSARATWLGRMVNEYSSAQVFDGLAAQIRVARDDLEALADLDAEALAVECAGFADEERRHGVLCGAVVEAFGGEAIAPHPERDTFPEHADATPVEALLRNALSIGCLSETVAVALIGAERLEMPDGPLRDLLTGIYADEVGHARFGWRLAGALVPKLDAVTRERLSRYLVVALQHLEEHELAHLPVRSTPPPEGARLGLCSGADARRLLYDTIERVILPGLDALGLRATDAWRSRLQPGVRRAS